MNELVGFVVLAVGGLLLSMVSLEVYDALAATIRRRRLRREVPASLDESTPTEPRFHLGESSFHLDGSGSLLRRRHRRHLVLEPRGRWGFATKWTEDP